MKLKAQKITLAKELAVPGKQAAIIRDNIDGDILVVQVETAQTRIKLSDLMEFLREQERGSTDQPQPLPVAKKAAR